MRVANLALPEGEESPPIEVVLHDPDIGVRSFISVDPPSIERWFNQEMAERQIRQKQKKGRGR